MDDMQPPLVDGQVWWRHIAQLPTNQWSDEIGNPHNILAVLREIDPLFQTIGSTDDSSPFAGLIMERGQRGY